MRILRAEDVRLAVGMPAAIGLMREAFAQVTAGEATMPERLAVSVPQHGGTALFMPAYLPASGALGLKVVSVFPSNAERQLPVVPAAVLLLDAETGLPRALLDGTYLTALRTGAAAGLATDLLARPDAQVATIFGAGGQAPCQLEAICRVRAIQRVWLVNRTPAHAEQLAERVAGWPEWRPREIRVAAGPGDIQAAVAEADVVATATSSSQPLFDGSLVRPGTHVNAIGAFTPTMRELDPTLLRRATIVVDQRTAAMAEAGDLLSAMREGALPADAAYTEIGEIVLGTHPGRTSRDQITCFKSVGVAAQDIAVASHVYREALRAGIGAEVEL